LVTEAQPSSKELKPLPRHLDILQVYRGAAATLVVLFHLTYWGGQPPFLQLPLWTPMLPTWRPAGLFRSGGNGVDLFFLLSGFVMVWGYGSEAGNLRRLLPFLWSRATRIYPTYWIVFALTVLYLYCRPGVGDPSELTAGALLRGVGLYGWGPWQVPPSGTLPFELTLYLAFGMLFVVGRVLFTMLATLWCGAVVAQWAGWSTWWFPSSYLPPQFFLTLSMLEFFLGALAAVFIRRFRPRASGWLLALAVALWAVVEVVESVELGQGYNSSVRLCMVPYLLLIVAGVSYELHTPRRYPWLLLLIGEASFSIYLTHYYLIWEINRFLPFESLGADGRRVVLLALVLAIGVGFWAAVERPLLKWLRRKSPARPRIADTGAASFERAREGVL
jgi:exopolysaccharide production protein ExoZ